MAKSPDNSAEQTEQTEQTEQKPAEITDLERRQKERRDVTDRRMGLDRRRGPGRRRSEDRKAAEEGEMTDEQFEFVMAVNEYKRVNKRPFPSWTEVLELVKALLSRDEPLACEDCACRKSLELAVWTDPARIDPARKKELAVLFQ